MTLKKITFVIGDVHGEAERLREMHDLILERHRLMFSSHDIRIVHLGDYVDRGPDSLGVINAIHGLKAQKSVEVVSLAGNHEEMMVKALVAGSGASYDLWIQNGGDATLDSYRRGGFRSVPIAHIGWLMSRPSVLIEQEEKRIFVHAGVDPKDFPNESKATYLWTRSNRFLDVQEWSGTPLEGWTVVHGHTPTQNFEPEVFSDYGTRVNIDTGAVFGGALTCAQLAPDGSINFFSV